MNIARPDGFMFLLLVLLLAGTASAAPSKAPLPADQKAVSTHEAFDPKDCSACHKNADPANPGPVTTPGNEMCLNCHDATQKLFALPHPHAAAKESCVNCHNPHNARKAKLLLDEAGKLCLGCHTAIQKQLSEFKVQHAPVDDCTGCHNPHGSPNDRLLKKEYPAAFYAGFDAKAYGLCFDCHDAKLVTAQSTTTETQFRDGSKNLHFLHVDRTERGRTCRACHDIHATTQEHLLRDSVPYGPNAWPLKTNWTKTPTGGTCTKTCHTTRTYDNSIPAPANK